MIRPLPLDLLTVPVPDGHIALTEAGSGPAVVLLHGGALDHRMWRRQVPVLAERHRVVALDARGHGRSSTPTAPFRHCDDVAVVLDALQIDRAAVVGLSMGAGTAVDTAVAYPDRVASLVLVAAGANAAPDDFSDPWVLDIQAAWRRAIQQGDAEGWVEAFLRFVHGPSRTMDDVPQELVAEQREMARHTVTTHAAAGAVPPEPVQDARERLGEIEVPVLAVHGSEDSSDHHRMAQAAADAVRGGRSVTIAETAHYPPMEQPDAFNRQLLAFLSGP